MITEPLIVTESGVLDAWLSATRILLDGGDRFNLTVHISSPVTLNEKDVAKYCHQTVDPRIRKSVYDVANTIFPRDGVLHTRPLQNFFEHYLEVYKRGQRKHSGTWGCYFLRLISFGQKRENQLAKVINGISAWQSKPRAAFVLHLSSTELDNPRPRGAPCWQYAQFLRSEDATLSLVAVYRSHDYFQKALGNFVGLTRLLKFVCHHGSMQPGTITCLSSYATLQGQETKARKVVES